MSHIQKIGSQVLLPAIPSRFQKENNSFFECLKKVWRAIADFFSRVFCCKAKVQPETTKKVHQYIKPSYVVRFVDLLPESKDHTVISKNPYDRHIKKPQVCQITEEKQPQTASLEEKTETTVGVSSPLSPPPKLRTEKDVYKFYKHVLDVKFPLEKLKVEARELFSKETVASRCVHSHWHKKYAVRNLTESQVANLIIIDPRDSAIKDLAKEEIQKEIAFRSASSKAVSQVLSKQIEAPFNAETVSSIVSKLEKGICLAKEEVDLLLKSLEALTKDHHVPDDVEQEKEKNSKEDLLKEELAIKQKKLLSLLLEHQKVACEQPQDGTVQAKKIAALKQDVIKLKSQIFRLNDLLEAKKNPGKRPEPVFFIKLNEKKNQEGWKKIGAPLEKIPAYLFDHPDPVDDKNRSKVSHLSDYHDTLKHLEKNFPLLEKLSDEQLETLFYQLYLKLLGNESLSPNASLLRKNESFTMKEQYSHLSEEEIGKELAKSDATAPKTFKELRELVHRWGDFKNAANLFSQRHWDVLKNLVIAVTPPPKGGYRMLGSYMKCFFAGLQKIMQNPALHPYQRAAFIQYSLVHLHPFETFSQRMALLLINIHFMQKGLPPIVILDKKEFLGLFSSANFEEAFCEYLHKTHQKMDKLATGQETG